MAALALLSLSGCKKTIQSHPSKLSGVGIVLQTTPTGPAISDIVAGGPAAGAGLHVGDRIIAVDGEGVEGKTLAAIVDSLRGQSGSSVVVRVKGVQGEATVTLTRQQLARNGTNYTVQ